MDGRQTIIITLQLYFRVSNDDVLIFDEICDLLLSYLIDESDENPPESEDMEAEIEALAREFSPDNQDDRYIIKDDLLKLLVNWWHAVTWARRDIRILIETEEFIADLVVPIKDEIMDDPDGKPYYKSSILEALLQMSEPPYGTTRHVRQRLPEGIDLNDALEYYKQLSRNHGFGNEYPVLLELLSIKLARNEERHLYFLLKAYKAHCREKKERPSYHGYISYRGMVMRPKFSVHCEHLFQRELYKKNNTFRS
jgi:hypothetical protein